MCPVWHKDLEGSNKMQKMSNIVRMFFIQTDLSKYTFYSHRFLAIFKDNLFNYHHLYTWFMLKPQKGLL